MIELSKEQLQKAINQLLVEEAGLNQLLQMAMNGLMYSERKAFLEENNVDNNKGNGFRYRHAIGFGKRLSLTIPRDRLGVFKPVILGLLKNQDSQMQSLCFNLYGNGLTTSQIGRLMEELYGEAYSPSAISSITNSFYQQMEEFRNRPLESSYPVVYIDAIHIKIRREQVSSEAFYVLLAVKKDVTREVIGISNIPSESASGWKEVLEGIKARGVQHIGLVVADGLPGAEDSIHQVFPEAFFQKCVVHLKRNILNKAKSQHKAQIATDLQSVFDILNPNDTFIAVKQRLQEFATRWQKHYPFIEKLVKTPTIDYYFTYLNFDYRIRDMIYTTNWIERLNKDFRRTLKIRNALPSFESALTLLSKVALDKEQYHYFHPITRFKFEPKLFPCA